MYIPILYIYIYSRVIITCCHTFRGTVDSRKPLIIIIYYVYIRTDLSARAPRTIFAHCVEFDFFTWTSCGTSRQRS